MSRWWIGLVAVTVLVVGWSQPALAADPWVVFEGTAGPGKGKHIVLVSGDDEYRSEECLPQLGKILAKHHGFKCTVLFAIDPATGTIAPTKNDNIPGLENLQTADLMILFTRMRNLPDEQAKHFADYIAAGKPIVALRTATHPFNFSGNNKTYAKWSFQSKDEEWNGGFGRKILGETWISHHGAHNKQSSRGIFAPGAAEHPILKGVADGELWGKTDVYGVRLPLPEGCQTLVLGQVLTGMNPTDPPVEGKQNNPMMPMIWTKTYAGADGKTGRVVTSTMGSGQDLLNAGLRRVLVNASYWCLGLEDQIQATSAVDLVGKYEPLHFSFGGHKKDVKPADWAGLE